MDRKQNVALLNPAFVSLGVKFRYPYAHQRSDDAAECAPGTHAGKSRNDWSSDNQWSDSWNRQHPNACQQSESRTKHSTTRNTCCRTLWCLQIFLMRQGFCGAYFGKQNRDIVVGKSCGKQVIDSSLCLLLRMINPEHDCCFLNHAPYGCT